MYERFTDNARQVLQRAHLAAQQFGYSLLGTEHLLLGLATGGRGAAGCVLLRAFGIDGAAVRLELQKAASPNRDAEQPPKLPLTPEAKQVVDAAIEAAGEHDDDHVETIHLLLALLSQTDGAASRLLARINAPLDRIREGIRSVLKEQELPQQRVAAESRGAPGLTDRARTAMRLAHQAAQGSGHKAVETEHILLGLLDTGPSVATAALENMGLNVAQVRENLTGMPPPTKRVTTTVSLPESPATMKAIQSAIQEAHSLGHGYVGAEHILLGLLNSADSTTSQSLARFGASYDKVRQHVIALLTHMSGKER